MEKKKQFFCNRKWRIKIILMIFVAPIVIFVIDLVNWGQHIFPFFKNLTERYDWLSFIGTYIGTIVSALFLLFITNMDRRENNEILRTAQRPYLEVSWTVLDSDFLEKKHDKLNRNLFVYNNFGLDGIDNANDYLVLEIKNSGASVAIVDVNKSNFTLEYDSYQGTVKGKDLFKKQVSNVKLNEITKRKSIASGESMFIVFNSCEYYNQRKREVSNTTYISTTEIYYKDLFNCDYEDVCKYSNGMINPEKDNSLLIDNTIKE